MAWPLHRYAVDPRGGGDGTEILNVLLRYSFVAGAAVLMAPRSVNVDALVFGKASPNDWGQLAYYDRAWRRLIEGAAAERASWKEKLKGVPEIVAGAWASRSAWQHDTSLPPGDWEDRLLAFLHKVDWLLRARVVTSVKKEKLTTDDGRRLHWQLVECHRGTGAARVEDWRGTWDGADEPCVDVPYLVLEDEDGEPPGILAFNLHPLVCLCAEEPSPRGSASEQKRLGLLSPPQERDERGQKSREQMLAEPTFARCTGTRPRQVALGEKRTWSALVPLHFPSEVVQRFRHDNKFGLNEEDLQRLRQEWRLERSLGRGSFGQVVLATRHDAPAGSPPSALKILARGPLSDKRVEVYRRLARLGSQLSGVVRYEDRPELLKQKPPTLVMEWIDGPTLDRHLVELDRDARVPLARALVQAVADLHRHGVTHRDLHPGNVLVRRRDGMPVLVDLGCAKDGANPIGTSRLSTAMLGRGWGVEPYAPRAQRAGTLIDEQWLWADLHALAWLLAYVLTGRAPPVTAEGPDDLRVHLRDALGEEGERWAGLAGWLEERAEARSDGAGDQAQMEFERWCRGNVSAYPGASVAPGWRYVAPTGNGPFPAWVDDGQGSLGLAIRTEPEMSPGLWERWRQDRGDGLFPRPLAAQRGGRGYLECIVVEAPPLGSVRWRDAAPIRDARARLRLCSDMLRLVRWSRRHPWTGIVEEDFWLQPSGRLFVERMRDHDLGRIGLSLSSVERLLRGEARSEVTAVPPSEAGEVSLGSEMDEHLDLWDVIGDQLRYRGSSESRDLDALVQEGMALVSKLEIQPDGIPWEERAAEVDTLVDRLEAAASAAGREPSWKEEPDVDEATAARREALRQARRAWRAEVRAVQARRARRQKRVEAADRKVAEARSRLSAVLSLPEDNPRHGEARLALDEAENRKSAAEAELDALTVPAWSDWIVAHREAASWVANGWRGGIGDLGTELVQVPAHRRRWLHRGYVPASDRDSDGPEQVSVGGRVIDAEVSGVFSLAGPQAQRASALLNQIVQELGNARLDGSEATTQRAVGSRLRALARLRSMTWWFVSARCCIDHVRPSDFEARWRSACATELGTWRFALPEWLDERGLSDLGTFLREKHEDPATLTLDLSALEQWSDLLRGAVETLDLATAKFYSPFFVGLNPVVGDYSTWCHGPAAFLDGHLLVAALPEHRPRPHPVSDRSKR
ncbi:protein kinase [Myxococcota bacterium]|nr:protein kinase [Myxococcota bacterium]